MGRAAGDGSHYTWVLRDLSTGKYDNSCTISLPSVTTIISKVLAKPQLVPWTYRETRDAISGLVNLFISTYPNDLDELIDVLADSDMLEAYLKENKLRPEDQTRDAQDRGKKAHSMLERMGELALSDDDSAADALAARILEKDTYTPFDKASAGWWLDRKPSVVASEERLMSLRYQYAGSTDLIWRDSDGALVVSDLKSRKAHLDAYDSDHIQAAAYAIAFEEMTGQVVDRETAIIVRDDGTWDEYVPAFDARATWLSILDTYNNMQRR